MGGARADLPSCAHLRRPRRYALLPLGGVRLRVCVCVCVYVRTECVRASTCSGDSECLCAMPGREPVRPVRVYVNVSVNVSVSVVCVCVRALVLVLALVHVAAACKRHPFPRRRPRGRAKGKRNASSGPAPVRLVRLCMFVEGEMRKGCGRG